MAHVRLDSRRHQPEGTTQYLKLKHDRTNKEPIVWGLNDKCLDIADSVCTEEEQR